MRYLFATLSLAFLASFLFLASHTFERPNLGRHLVCVDGAGHRTVIWADTKECHRPRALLQVMFSPA